MADGLQLVSFIDHDPLQQPIDPRMTSKGGGSVFRGNRVMIEILIRAISTAQVTANQALSKIEEHTKGCKDDEAAQRKILEDMRKTLDAYHAVNQRKIEEVRGQSISNSEAISQVKTGVRWLFGIIMTSAGVIILGSLTMVWTLLVPKLLLLTSGAGR